MKEKERKIQVFYADCDIHGHIGQSLMETNIAIMLIGHIEEYPKCNGRIRIESNMPINFTQYDD